MASKVDDKIEPEEAMREIYKKESTDTNDGEMTVKPAVGMEALRKPAAKRLKLHEAATTQVEEATPRYKIPPDVLEAINRDILLMAQGREPEMKASVDINLYKTSAKMLDDGLET